MALIPDWRKPPGAEQDEVLATETVGVAMRGFDEGERARFNSALSRIKANLADSAAADKAAE